MYPEAVYAEAANACNVTIDQIEDIFGLLLLLLGVLLEPALIIRQVAHLYNWALLSRRLNEVMYTYTGTSFPFRMV